MKKLNSLKLIGITSVLTVFIALSCAKNTPSDADDTMLTITETGIVASAKAKDLKSKTAFKLADGLQIELWASDSLAPDPIAMSINDAGDVFLTRTNRQKNSEFDIRGYRNWMTESISLSTYVERQQFLRKTFATEKSEENNWLKDLNLDGVHDWKDLAVEKDEVWKLQDTDGDGFADISTRVLNDFHEEYTDVAGALLVRESDAFVGIAPDMWRIQDTNGDGYYNKKTSISKGFGVHIGFGGHGMSGATEGPDGKIYWGIGDIGFNAQMPDGTHYKYPNEGVIVRSNPDGSDFEVFSHGHRNTHEFVFDDYGNLITSDNDGDHRGESERLVHVIEGSDSGWRSNWQYGKYTDEKNNGYNVWMDEKLFVPRWDMQAAHIIPPIQNYHNGPTGMVHNPGHGLGKKWQNKFFLVEFVGNPSRSHIWSFGLKPKGASFVLDGETDVLSGILPTGIRFGPEGALYIADWVNGWNTKNYGRVWKLDVTAESNDLIAERAETKRLIQQNYKKQSAADLANLLSYADQRIRRKAQFELAERGIKGYAEFVKIIENSQNQLARIHAIWGIGQLAAKDKLKADVLPSLLSDSDSEIIAQAAKVIGDLRYNKSNNKLVSLLKNSNPRVKLYAMQALGRTKEASAVQPLLKVVAENNDEDVYIRHAAVLALSRIGNADAMVKLVNDKDESLRLAAVLVLRKLSDDRTALFLNDKSEFIVTEAARAINDDYSIEGALPELATMLASTKFDNEPLVRRMINANLRVGGEASLDRLLTYANRTNISQSMKAEALATLGTFANPSVLDRVDGRYRGEIKRDIAMVRNKVKPSISKMLASNNAEVLTAASLLLSELQIEDFNEKLVGFVKNNPAKEVREAALVSLGKLNYKNIGNSIVAALNDSETNVRSAALALIDKTDVTKESLAEMVALVNNRKNIKEQQQLLIAMAKLPLSTTEGVLKKLVGEFSSGNLDKKLGLELSETIEKSKSETLAKLFADASGNMGDELAEYQTALYGGNGWEGRKIFNNNSAAQCVRCHVVEGKGGEVGPDLTKIATILSREQILEAIVAPSARLAPGYGYVSVTLKDGQEASGILAKETEDELIITTSDAEPLEIAKARIASRQNMPSSMPPMGMVLSKREIRDVVEYLSNLK
jgi:quinoprotein glucose dehydrogenase